MKVLPILSISLVLLSSGCKNSVNAPSGSSNLSGDDQLRARLTGKWICEGVEVLTFCQDGTFSDSISHQLLHGQFAISGGIISYSNTHYSRFDTSVLAGPSIAGLDIRNPSLPSFSGDSLTLNEMDVFTRTSSDSSQLGGSWQSIIPVALAWNSSPIRLLAGSLTTLLELFPDSSRYHVHVTNGFGIPLFDTISLLSADSSGSYVYAPPLINIAGHRGAKVEFSGVKMYWIFAEGPLEFKRQ